MSDEPDPGVRSGDEVMTIATERELDILTSQYDCASHTAALSDIITTVLRNRSTLRYERPEDRTVKSLTWVSGAFLEPTGLRLRGIRIVDRWSDERRQAELHSWRTLGEQAVYELPMTLTVIVVGQRRDGRHHSPWSRGYLHPKSRFLRIASRVGNKSAFSGFIPCWREECDNISRDKWIDQMEEDGAMSQVLMDVDLPVPDPAFLSKIRHLAEKKMQQIAAKDVPPPNISACDWPTPCMFRKCCWSFTEPSERNGFFRVLHN